MRNSFSSYHPIINLCFFIGTMIWAMMIFHPIFLGLSFITSAIYCVIVCNKGWNKVIGMIPLFLVVSFLNPFFNTKGETVLFTYLSGRSYTLEALLYGIALSAMLITVLLWFASYNEIMTSDKFIYCFGKVTPSISLVLTMILRYVPMYKKKALQISTARTCIGKGAVLGTNSEKMHHSLSVLSALTSWALEGGIGTGDSMLSRGYGVGKRSSFSIYRWHVREMILFGYMMVLVGVVFICYMQGGMKVAYTPELQITTDKYTWIAMGAYMLFLVIPIIIEIREKVIWYILKSRI